MIPSLGVAVPVAPRSVRPPAWLVVATGTLAVGCLALAVAETNLWMHYVIDAGESISLVGLGFILVSGIYLFTRGQLKVSLPLAAPWLLFPIITQGDQLIDNLSINWMRLIVHVLLAALFAMPVAVIVMAIRHMVVPAAGQSIGRISKWFSIVPGLQLIASGRLREGTALLATVLFLLEMWVAVRFLGELMVIALIAMIAAVLTHGFAGPSSRTDAAIGRRRGEQFALAMLLGGVALSAGLFVGFKNRPGAYQGSPSAFMDPASREGEFRVDRIPVPPGPASLPVDPEAMRVALAGYARAFERLVAGYYILDRNYNYDFHNRLFLRSTPLLADYRAVGLQEVDEAKALWAAADRVADEDAIAPGLPLGALVHDVRDYAAFTFGRAPILERMSATFQQTPAGLQHATHLYEGEGKMLGVRLAELLEKHRAVLEFPAVTYVTAEFTTISRSVYDVYANRIVGF